ncbi:MAG: CAP domain-containing protein [Chloroflexota bacterium]|nr:MAG: CAP domain-containing protein [Chloroflexota bacterium]
MSRVICRLILSALLLSGASAHPAQAQDAASVLMERINALRASQGLNTLNYNGALAAAAQAHSQYLASTPYTHPHRQSNGSLPQDRAAAAGYSGRVGENVVGGGMATLDWAYNWWLNSPVHYSNMLGNWTDIGVGFSSGTYGKWYVVVFGDNGSAPAPARSAANPASGRAVAPPTAAPPRPTRPPTATPTPTVTLTPSLTFTPRATFTPTETPTFLPATETPILIAISTAAPDAPTATPAMLTSTPLSVAVRATAAPTELTPRALEHTPSNPLRLIVPIILILNVLIIGSAVLSSRLRRSQ